MQLVMGTTGAVRGEVYVGRQPIFDRGLSVAGYELLFRARGDDRANMPDGDRATASVLSSALTEIGLERLVGTRPAWINVTREFVLSGLAETMPADLTVLEIVEDQVVDAELIEAVAQLKRHGYRIALDDFVCSPEIDALLALADIVKLDIRRLGREGMARHAAALASVGATLLAEKVETHEEYEWSRAMGCELFQGFFFCRPEVIRDRRVTAGRASLLRFVTTLQDPAVQFEELEALITRDVALSYRLLCYVNSAFFGLRGRVNSILQALALLGVENLRRWATLSLFAGVATKPRELTVTALLRARFCELAGAALPDTTAAQRFTLGLFSVVDALFDAPIDEILRSTPFPLAMREALATHHGVLGRLLECVVHLEEGRPNAAAGLVPDASALYLDALLWAGEAAGSLFDEEPGAVTPA